MPRRDQQPEAEPPRRPSQELVLAALARAVRHRPDGAAAVSARAVLAHLQLPLRSGPARAAGRRLDELLAAGEVARSRRHGVEVWTLTREGLARLRRADADRSGPELPESPQHRAWRHARTVGSLEMERLRELLEQTLGEGERLLAEDPPPHSDAWFELAEALRRAAWLVGSAVHCLSEWEEPDDVRADVDDRRRATDRLLEPSRRARLRALRGGRRNIRLWDDRRD